MYDLWPLAIVGCVALICVAFVAAVKIGQSNAPDTVKKLALDNRRLRGAIYQFLNAQDQPPGNWDAVDQLRAAVDK